MISFTFSKINTFCISLETNKERWYRMQKRFEEQNLDVTRWIASTPYNLIDNFHNYLSKEERACAQSHILIWKHMLKHNIEYALIFEDDAVFNKNWKNMLLEFKINDPQWDLILLNASEPVIPSFTWTIAKEQYLTAGYILSLKGANLLLQLFNNNYASSDWMTSRLQNNNHSYCYFPWPIIQDGIDSTLKTNNNDLNDDKAKVLRCLNEIGYDILSNYNI